MMGQLAVDSLNAQSISRREAGKEAETLRSLATTRNDCTYFKLIIAHASRSFLISGSMSLGSVFGS